MRRTRIELTAIADLNHLGEAAGRAARGKRYKPHIAEFFAELEARLEVIANDLYRARAPYNRYFSFTIHDPKRRTIHAPCFEDRIVHHALIGAMGPRLERSLTAHTFACRQGKGPLAAVLAVQKGIRRFPWYVKIDVRSYFDSIHHATLRALLARRFKGGGLFRLLDRLLAGYATEPGRGLPIGSLTSQHFANLYLDGLDRLLADRPEVWSPVRYMDDVLWWCEDKLAAKQSLDLVRSWLLDFRHLELKGAGQINRGSHGVTYCGCRVSSAALRLTRRRKRRYSLGRLKWEHAFRAGEVDAIGLQMAYDALLGMVHGEENIAWRRLQCSHSPPPDL